VIVINQGITHHTKFNHKNVQTCSFKGNLPLEYEIRHQFTVQQVEKGGKIVIVMDQGITHHTKFNHKNVQTCSFKGNLPPEYE